MSILVHIGYFKTASTWLQRHVFSRRDRGFYPLAPERVDDPIKACKYLAKPMLRERSGYPLTPFDQGQEWLSRLMKKVDFTQPGQPVISNERLSGYPMAGGHDSLTICNRLHHAFPTAKILIVIRNQHQMIRSCYVQYLRRGGTQSLKQILTPFKESRLPRFTPRFFMYHELIKAYQDTFGRESVLVLPYELFTTRPQEFVDAIYRFCGMTADYDFPFDDVENQSSLNYIEYKTRHLNMFTMQTSLNGFSEQFSETRRDRVDWVRQLLDRWVSDKKKAKHDRKMRKMIRDHVPNDYFASSNDLTSSLIGIDLATFGYATERKHAKRSKAVPTAEITRISA